MQQVCVIGKKAKDRWPESTTGKDKAIYHKNRNPYIEDEYCKEKY